MAATVNTAMAYRWARRARPIIIIVIVLLTAASTQAIDVRTDMDYSVPYPLYRQTAYAMGPGPDLWGGLASATTLQRSSGNSSEQSEILMTLMRLPIGPTVRIGYPCLFLRYFRDISYSAGQTWRQDIVLPTRNATLHLECLCRRYLSWRAATDPTRREMVFFGFGSDLKCNNKIALVAGTEMHVVTSSGAEHVPWAYWPAITTIAVAKTTTEYTYKLVTFGGSACSGTGAQCQVFTNDLWSVTIDTGRRAAGRWEKLQVVANSTRPLARAGAFLFRDQPQRSLLLFGGVRMSAGVALRCLDFWRYSLSEKRWTRLRPTNSSHRPAYPYVRRYNLSYDAVQEVSESLKAAFHSHTGVVTILHRRHREGIVHDFYVTVCRVQGPEFPEFHCEEAKEIGTTVKADIIWGYLQAGTHAFFIIRTLMKQSIRVYVSASLEGNRGQLVSAISQVRNPLTSPKFPGFQGCVSAAPIVPTLPSDRRKGGFLNRKILMVGGQCNSEQTSWKTEEYHQSIPGTPIWTLNLSKDKDGTVFGIYGMQYAPTGPPTRTDFTFTALTMDYRVILFGGRTTAIGQLADPIPWCFSMDSSDVAMGQPSWQKVDIPPDDPYPRPRYGHVAFNLSSTMLLVHGGFTNVPETFGGSATTFCDIWLLVVKGNSCSGYWKNVTSAARGELLPCRAYHTATKVTEGVLLYGGAAGNDSRRAGSERAYDQSLTLLQIDISANDVIILVKHIPIVPSIPVRFRHSLTWYTATDLLLLGGWHSFDDAYVCMTNMTVQVFRDPLPAYLIQLSRSGENFTAKAIPFFNFTIAAHHVAGATGLVFSGVAGDACIGNVDSSFIMLRNGQNCPIGYGRTHNDSCQPCAIGYYAGSIAEQCQKCGALLTTNHAGAAECIAQDPCTSNFCNGHGQCSVDNNNKAYCRCKFGYLPSDNCKLPTVYLSQLAAVVFTAIITTLVISVVKFIKKRRDYRNKDRECRDNYSKLSCSERKIKQINEGAKLNWKDLTIQQPPLSQGAHSTVFKALLTDMTVVVKQFKEYVPISDSTPYDIFIKEAETLRSLRHPNIVMFLAAGTCVDKSTRHPFLVMEYLQQGSLYDILHDNTIHLAHDRRIKFALDGARGMEYLHGSNPPRLHRDIKSPNLLVGGNGVLKIGDLETARLLAILARSTDVEGSGESARRRSGRVFFRSRSRGDTSQSQPLIKIEMTEDTTYERPRVGMSCGVGTDRWRSPESIIKANTYNEKTDVYSFGIVLWEILTRETPYGHLTDSEQIHDEIKAGNKPILPASASSAPYPFRHLAERCIKTDPDDRPSFPDIRYKLEGQMA